MSGTAIAPRIEGITPIFVDPEGRISHGAPDAPGQTAMFIDPVNGNNEDSGLTSATAIGTHEEFRGRIGNQIINVPMTVTLLGNFGIDNPVWVFFDLGPTGSLTYEGTPTQLYSSAISGFTPLNRATSQPWEIADAALPVSWTASGLLNTTTSGSRRVRLTSGTPGAVAWTVKEPAARNARISPFMVETLFPVPTPAIGNTFVVESLSTIADLLVDVRTSSIIDPSFRIPVIFHNIEIPPPTAGADRRPTVRVLTPHGSSGPTVNFFGCEVGRMEWVGPGISGHTASKYSGPAFHFANGSIHTQFGCAIFGNQTVEGDCIYDFDCIFQGAGIFTQGSGRVLASQVGVFDRVGDAVTIRTGGTLESANNIGGTHQLYGNGNTLFGIRFQSGAVGLYVTQKPVVTGTQDVNLAGTPLAYAAIPATDPVELAMLRIRL